MLSSGTHWNTADVRDLAEFLHRRTYGNLMFLYQMLEKLQDNNLLTYDFLNMKWQWDMENLQRRSSL
jgi:predicted ATPase